MRGIINGLTICSAFYLAVACSVLNMRGGV